MAKTRSREGALEALALFALLGLLAAFKMGQDVDHDLFWQLKDGQRIVVEHRLPLVEEYSFTAAGAPLPATEWLAEALTYSIFDATGYGGLLVFNVALFLSTFALVLALARRRLPLVESLCLVALLSFAFVNFYGVRAQNWTFLFTTLFLVLAARWEDGDAKAPWMMAGLLLPWANMHGGFMLGVGILGLFGSYRAWRSRRWEALAPPALGVLLCCAHPNGFGALSYPIWFMAAPPPGRALIVEWSPVDFNSVTAAPYLVVFGLLFWAGLGKKAASPWTALTVVTAVMAVRGRKLLPEFCLAAMASLAAGCASMGAKAARKILIPVGLACLCALSAVVATNRRSSGLDLERYFPREAASLLASNHPGARVFNNYGWGGYLIWKLYPGSRVFIDGRLDPYWDLLPGDYATIIEEKPGWRDLLDRYRVTAALIRPTDRLGEGLSREPAWKLEYADQRSVLFTR